MKVPAAAMFAHPTPQAGDSKNVAELVAFLASNRGHWITGENYHFDGGLRIWGTVISSIMSAREITAVVRR